eukprot:7065085-Alexandrium_andersonii.AAC.1
MPMGGVHQKSRPPAPQLPRSHGSWPCPAWPWSNARTWQLRPPSHSAELRRMLLRRFRVLEVQLNGALRHLDQ